MSRQSTLRKDAKEKDLPANNVRGTGKHATRSAPVAARAAAAAEEAKQINPAEFDRLIHEQQRLGIVSALAVNDTLSFNDLKRLMKTTDGNLSIHARKLEDAGYITCAKSFDGRIPRTEYTLSAAGRKALKRYLNHMEQLIRATREG